MANNNQGPRLAQKTVDFPTPTIGITLPGCAENVCNEYLAAGVVCATASGSINSCYYSGLSWPAAYTSACPNDGDQSAVASRYWGLRPSAMNAHLGQLGISRAKGSTISMSRSVDVWAVQQMRYLEVLSPKLDSNATIPRHAQWSRARDHQHQVSSMQRPSTPSSTPALHKSNGSVIALGIFIPILVSIISLLLYLLYQRRTSGSGPVHLAVIQPVDQSGGHAGNHIPTQPITETAHHCSELLPPSTSNTSIQTNLLPNTAVSGQTSARAQKARLQTSPLTGGTVPALVMQ